MSYSISCVHCQAVLKSAAPVPAGKKVRCPKCKQLFTTPADNSEPVQTPTPAAPQPKLPETLADDDEMAAAIAKLEGEQALGNKPGAVEIKPAPAFQAPPPDPLSNADVSEEDEMDAAIAKLEAEQTLGKKPAAPEPKPAPVVQAAPMVAAAPEEEIPEIDDDLVVPDEEEPVNKKKVPGKIVEEVSKKSKRREDEESEAEEPRAKKKKRLEEEEVEEPKVKKKKSRASDEEDEEEPPAKIKKGREEEDGAFSDKPQTTAKKSRVEDDENEEEDEVEEEPRRGKKKKKAGSPMLLVLLISGGILGLFACCGCGIGGYFMFASNSLVGKWEGDLFVVKVQFDFHRGGTGTLSFKAPDGAGMGGKAEEATMHFNYKVSGSNPMILEIEPTKIDSKDGKVRFDQRDVGGRLRVTMEGDTMTLVELEPRGGVAVPLKLRRVR